MTAQFRKVALVIVPALLLSACSGVTDPSKNKVETFTGTVAVGAAGNVHLFNASENGEFSVRLTAISPNAASILGVLYGQPTGATCGAIITANPQAGLSADALSTGINKGSYCIQIYDSGNLTATQNYTVNVSHP